MTKSKNKRLVVGEFESRLIKANKKIESKREEIIRLNEVIRTKDAQAKKETAIKAEKILKLESTISEMKKNYASGEEELHVFREEIEFIRKAADGLSHTIDRVNRLEKRASAWKEAAGINRSMLFLIVSGLADSSSLVKKEVRLITSIGVKSRRTVAGRTRIRRKEFREVGRMVRELVEKSSAMRNITAVRTRRGIL